jgi:hypothetical protein
MTPMFEGFKYYKLMFSDNPATWKLHEIHFGGAATGSVQSGLPGALPIMDVEMREPEAGNMALVPYNGSASGAIIVDVENPRTWLPERSETRGKRPSSSNDGEWKHLRCCAECELAWRLEVETTDVRDDSQWATKKGVTKDLKSQSKGKSHDKMVE